MESTGTIGHHWIQPSTIRGLAGQGQWPFWPMLPRCGGRLDREEWDSGRDRRVVRNRVAIVVEAVVHLRGPWIGGGLHVVAVAGTPESRHPTRMAPRRDLPGEPPRRL